MSRKTMDCRLMPSESNCTLVISGEEEEVVRAATLHAVDVHGHQDSPELQQQLRQSLTDEMPVALSAGDVASTTISQRRT